MGEALGWGLISASSLVIGSLVAIWVHINLRVIGLIMGFGSGVLISAVAFDLVEEAGDLSSGQGAVAWGLFIGCGVFFGGEWLISASAESHILWMWVGITLVSALAFWPATACSRTPHPPPSRSSWRLRRARSSPCSRTR